MLRLDFYVQHLVRQGAAELLLASNEPVRFKFGDGEMRQSNAPIDHAQIAQLVQEASPPAASDELRRTQKTKFLHITEAGVRVDVQIDAPKPNEWRVSVRAASEAAAPRAPQHTAHGAHGAHEAHGKTGSARKSTSGARKSIRMPAAQVGTPAPAPVAASPAPVVASPAPAPAGTAKPTAMAATGTRLEPTPGEPRLNHWLRMMVAVGASDLHCTSDTPPLVRRHGEMQVLFDRPPVTTQELREVLMEIIPARNKAQFDESNDTDFAHAIEGVARFRANYFMDRRGIGAVFRQIPFKILTPEQLGVPPKVLELCYLSKGLVLVTGPTGSGKSTTLAALLDVVNEKRHDHIITIEDPIEFVHPTKNCLVNQREVGVHTTSFKSALRAALREDPDVVLVGEMRDLETIAIAIETAETGHLVFGTLHTTSAPSTVDRIIDQFPADRQEQIRTMLSESIRGVVSQMLCKKKGGGRIAAYEILIATPAVANLIREGKTFQLQSVMQTGRGLGMQTMNDHLIELVKTDKVEPEEAFMKSNDKTGFKDLLTKNNLKLNL